MECNMIPVFTWEGTILDGSAILVGIFDSNYSSWFPPSSI